jgi:hypothetical protein
LRLSDGRDVPFPLLASPPPPDTEPAGPYSGTVTGTLPTAAPPGARLFAVTLSETTFAATRRQHHEGEGGTALALAHRDRHAGPPAV